MLLNHVHFPSELPVLHGHTARQVGRYPKMAQCKGLHDRETYDLCWEWASLSAVPCNESRESSKFAEPLDLSESNLSTSLVLQRSTTSDRLLFVNIAEGRRSLVFDFTNGLIRGRVRPNVDRSLSTFTLPTRRSQKHTSSLKRSLSFTNRTFARSSSEDSSSSDSSIEGVDGFEHSLAL